MSRLCLPSRHRLALCTASLLGAFGSSVNAQDADIVVRKLVAPAAALAAKGPEALYKTMEQARADTKLPEVAVEALNPLGGTLPLPRGWVLYEEHTALTYGWLATMAPAAKEYRGEARMRAVLQPNVLKAEKRKASLTVAGQVAELVKQHPDMRACEPSTAGPFTKVCYDYEMALRPEPAPKFHIRIAFYYSDALDLVAQTAFSAPVDKWKQYEPVLAKMDALTFFDVKKYGSQTAATAPAAAKK